MMVAEDTRRCGVCGRLLSEVEAEKGSMTTTLSAPQTGRATHLCSTKCWDIAMRRVMRRIRKQ